MKIIYLQLKKAKKLFFLKFLCLISIILFFQGCIKDDFSKLSTSGWQPDFASALINTNFELKDFLKKDTSGAITEDPATNFLTVIYSDSPFSQKANEVMKLDSQAASVVKGLPATMSGDGVWLFPTVVMQDSSEQISSFSNEDNVLVEKIDIKSGKLQLSVVSDFKFSGEITITLPTLKDANGNGTTIALPFTYVPGNETKNTTFIEIPNSTMDMSMGGTTANTFPLKYKLKAEIKTGTPYNSSQKITVNILLKDVIFSYVDGYFGSIPLDIDDALEIGLFNNLSGSIYLSDPKVDLTINNSYGIPIDVKFDTLRAKPNTGGAPVNLTGPEISNTISIPFPSINEVGQSKSKIISLNQGTSNISSMIASSPVSFKYAASIKTNPNGQVVGQKNFITDSSAASLDVNLTIPLWGTLSNISAQDTSVFDLGEDLGKLESTTFKLTTDNGFPIDVRIQVYFVDSTYSPYKRLDSLITDGQSILTGAVVDKSAGPNQGKVISSSKKITTITLDEPRLQKLKTANKIIIKGVLNSSEAGSVPVRVSSTNNLTIKLGVRVKIKGL